MDLAPVARKAVNLVWLTRFALVLLMIHVETTTLDQARLLAVNPDFRWGWVAEKAEWTGRARIGARQEHAQQIPNVGLGQFKIAS